MYAGWGGIGFAHERALAEAVRRLRDLSLAQGHSKLLWQRALGIGLRTAAHYPWVYGLSGGSGIGPAPLGRAGRWLRRNRWPEPAPPTGAGRRSNPRGVVRRPHLRSRMAFALDAPGPRPGLVEPPAGAGLSHGPSGPARRYHEDLRASKASSAGAPSSALSHYTVRLDAAIRNTVKERLWQRGFTPYRFGLFPNIWTGSGSPTPSASARAHQPAFVPLDVHGPC